MFNLNINLSLRDYIDSVREGYSRPKYIIQCLNYIRDNKIDIYNHYEGEDKNERTSKNDKGRENIDRDSM